MNLAIFCYLETKTTIEIYPQENPSTPLAFYQVPFLYLIVPFCVGILIQYHNPNLYHWVLMSAVLFFITLILYILYRLTFYPLTFFLFLQLGYFSMQLNRQEFTSSLTQGTELYQLKILETSNSQKTWNKGLARIEYMQNDQGLVRINRNILFYTDQESIQLISENDVILASCKVARIQNKGNPGEFNSELYWGSKQTDLLTFFDFSDFSILKNHPITLKNSIQQSLNSVIDKYIPKDQAGLAKALFLGDKSNLRSEITQAFSAAGGMHLLAISGLHIGLMIIVLMRFFRFFSRFLKRTQALILILCFVWFYAYIIGFPPSVVRSVFMFSLFSLGSITGNQNNQLNLLCFSALILLLFHPWFIFDMGFQLSYAAMLGIVTAFRFIHDLFSFKHKMIEFLWNGTALGLSAQIFTAPLCLYYFHQFPNYFILSNLGIIITSGIIISLGALLFVSSGIPLIPIVIGFLLYVLLYALSFFMSWIQILPGATAKGFDLTITDMSLFYLIIALFFTSFVLRKYRFLQYAGAALLISFILFHRHDNLNHEHVVLFNSNKLCFAIHGKNHISFFYDDQKENEHKYQRIITSYEKCYPGLTKLYSIKNQNIDYKINQKHMQFKHFKNHKKLSINGKEYRILYENNPINTSTTNTIGMPWVEGLQTRLNKALILPF